MIKNEYAFKCILWEEICDYFEKVPVPNVLWTEYVVRNDIYPRNKEPDSKRKPHTTPKAGEHVSKPIPVDLPQFASS